MVDRDDFEEGITMPDYDYDDFDDPKLASEDDASSLDVFQEDGETPTDDGPELDPNKVRRPGRPHGDPDERPVDETVDTTAHTPEGLDLGATELSAQDLSGRMTGAGLIGITPEGAADAKRTGDPRGVERPSVGDGPPTRRKDPVERDEHGRPTGRTTVDPDSIDQSDGSPFDLSGGPNAKFGAQSAGEQKTVIIKHDDGSKTTNVLEGKELVSSHTTGESKLGHLTTSYDTDNKTGKTTTKTTNEKGEVLQGSESELLVPLVQDTGGGTDGGTKTPYEDPTISIGAPVLATEELSARARAELEADAEGDGRGSRGPRKVKDKPDVDASQTPADEFSAQINPVDPRQQEEYGPGELTVSQTDLVTDPPQAGAASDELDGGIVPAAPSSSAPQESGDPLLDPNQWLGGGDTRATGAVEPVGPTPTPPPAPEPVAAEPVAPAEVPAPQVGPSPAEGQPGDFAGPAPGDAPDFNAAAADGDEPGRLDDAV